MKDFSNEVAERLASNANNETLLSAARQFTEASIQPKYSYNYSALGRPIIQYPQDMVAMQQLIWEVKPDLIIETGIAHGGSLIMSASMLALLDMCDAIEEGSVLRPAESKRQVLGIDIDIRDHNKLAIMGHPMSSRIQMIQGSSVEPEVVQQVHKIARDYKRVLVCLDSNHTHEHVLAELEAFAPLCSVGSYCVVFDTVVEDLPKSLFDDRPWGPGDNPKTAVWEFLSENKNFQVDTDIQNRLLVTVAPDGYLKRIA
ncbi:cephalosporin hydroxylase family protein [Luminiphilus sp.]|nr:cephalosporin hydroxylase family protein [Luminiphilus sp.]